MKTLQVEYHLQKNGHFIYVSTGATPQEHDETLKAFSFTPDGNLNGKSFRGIKSNLYLSLHTNRGAMLRFSCSFANTFSQCIVSK